MPPNGVHTEYFLPFWGFVPHAQELSRGRSGCFGNLGRWRDVCKRLLFESAPGFAVKHRPSPNGRKPNGSAIDVCFFRWRSTRLSCPRYRSVKSPKPHVWLGGILASLLSRTLSPPFPTTVLSTQYPVCLPLPLLEGSAPFSFAAVHSSPLSKSTAPPSLLERIHGRPYFSRQNRWPDLRRLNPLQDALSKMPNAEQA